MKRSAKVQKCRRIKGLGTIYLGPHIHPRAWWDLNPNLTVEKSTNRYPFNRMQNNL